MAASIIGFVLCAGIPTLDITASGLDYWVAWTASGGDREIRSSAGAEATLSGGYGSTSLTLMEDAAGVPTRLIAMGSSDEPWSDSSWVYLLDPATLSTMNSTAVSYMEVWPETKPHEGCSIFQLGAQSVIDDDTGCVLFAGVQTNYTLSGADNGVSHYKWQCAAILDIADSGPMAFRESSSREVALGASCIPPVQTGPSYWVSGWGGYEGGGYMPFVYCVKATGYDGSSGSGPLDSSTLYYAYDVTPNDATIFCAGNCSTGASVIWQDYEKVTQYSLISSTSSPVPDTSLAMPPWPDGQPPLFAAMSDSRDDPGALLAWFDGDHVWCRYFDGQWNDWSHLLSTGGPVGVNYENLGVCSAQDGFYVAWLEIGSDEPTVVYVPTSEVTGMDGSGPEPAGLLLEPSSNPFVSATSVTCTGTSVPSRLEVFDLAGRLVRDLTEHQGPTFLWDGRDGSGTAVPSGAYLIRGAVDGGMAAIRVVKL